MAAAKAKAAEAETDNAADDAAEKTAKPAKKFLPKLSLKTMIIAVVGLAVVGGGGTYGYLHFFKHEKKEEAAVVKPAVFVDMPDVLVNLANSGADRTQYLKVKVVLEVPEQALVTQITPLMPRVMDAFQTLSLIHI